MKALVDFSLNDCLQGINVERNKDGSLWAELKYERLGQFCYFSRRVGHEEESCAKSAEGKAESQELGPWLRAS